MVYRRQEINAVYKGYEENHSKNPYNTAAVCRTKTQQIFNWKIKTAVG